MKILFYTLVIIALVALATWGVIDSILGYAGTMLDDSGKSYVDGNLHAILDKWSADELAKRESDEFRQTTSDAQLNSVFSQYRQLGPPKSFGGATGHASVDPTGDGLKITATYLVNGTFANGPAEIKISLIQIKGEWQILGFRVTSPIFE